MREKLKALIRMPQNYPKVFSWVKSSIVIIVAGAFGTINYPWPIGTSPILDSLKAYMLSHWVIIPMAIVFPAALNLLHEMWDHWAKNDIVNDINIIPEKRIFTLLNGIKAIVGAKYERFSRYIAESRSSSTRKTYGSVFNEITQPELQITEIVKQLFYCLKSMLNDRDFKLLLVKIDGNRKSYIAYLPPMDKPPDDLLTRADTFFDEILGKGQVVVIPDIKAELKRQGKKKKKYAQLPGESDSGSIIGMPIRNRQLGNNVRYIMTMKSDLPDFFTGHFEKTFGKICEEFFHRILIEDNLQEIKRNAIPCSCGN